MTSEKNEKPEKIGHDTPAIIIALEILAPIIYFLYILFLMLYGNCSTLDKFNPNVIARINETLLSDPRLANVLRNNTYSLIITDTESYPYIDISNGTMKCHLSKVTAEIRFSKPVSIMEQYETQAIWTIINFDEGIVNLYRSEPTALMRP
ncbi:MAG: hypothetical protein JHC26_11750 [Thermofilum sp.]|jgi:hypothetical protein|uniref:hypothetical protein n=1 Tax=Thermofilum sp. TaxID=1961369 RepID=UPI002585D059|nr:hypothetical protein [Thermofilum sp.]MCI4409757.1 hypothetical protein [Thermofilum sp.]